MSVSYLVLVGLLGALPIYLDKNGPAQSWNGLYSASSNLLCIILLSVIASQTFGHEYRYGLIRLTLTEFPKRERIFVAKLILLFVYYILIATAGWSLLGIIGATAPEGRVSADVEGFSMSGTVIPELWKSFAFGWSYLVIAFAITVLTRNLALGIVLPFVMSTLGEQLITALSTLAKGRMDWLVHSLPFTNADAWLSGNSELNQPGLVYLAWVVGILLLSAIRFHKSDA